MFNGVNKKGFTIVELLVVIGIIGIMSGAMAFNFRKVEQQNKLQRSAQQILQSIREAQNMALSSAEFDGQIYDYYGVHFNTKDMPNSYYIFVSDNKTYNAGEEVRTIDLGVGIIIDSISPSEGNKLDVTFQPPYSFVEFSPSGTDATVTVKKKDGTHSQDYRYIKVNDKGWMSVKTTP